MLQAPQRVILLGLRPGNSIIKASSPVWVENMVSNLAASRSRSLRVGACRYPSPAAKGGWVNSLAFGMALTSKLKLPEFKPRY